ncbi:MAG: ribosome silencing factor [Flavobacteriales bacterium CG_4_10_14_0_2_um_filter_32_8]|nr:MAG: ribosome silencing factor [Flavobacteriales bacterium CG_4_10_14_0_2_um_filter_32_8]PJB14969.1 MAG: ribosome silencing factor [Flavobacteriales bacterium CG_4_9_14_3_um_filter_32_8]
MGKKKQLKESEILIAIAIKGLQDKKGKNIVGIDLRELDNSVCDYFILCTGTSNTHVNALADSVSEEVRKSLNEKPWHFEGFGNAEWIILDYVTTVVHIFQEDARNFYNLDELWADAKIIKIEE